jgi:hypothetical protein
VSQAAPASRSGPHVSLAVICEKVLTEQDGVISVIRVIDRIINTVAGLDVPEQMPPMDLAFVLVVTLKSDAARGRHTVKLRPETPSGHQLPEHEIPILFEGEDRGTNIIVNFGIRVEEEGLYWFDVFLDDNQLLTRIPLRIVYQPQRIAGM